MKLCLVKLLKFSLLLSGVHLRGVGNFTQFLGYYRCHLVNELLLELSEQIPVEVGTQFLDLGSANVLEDQLKFLMETVDELNQESIKFNKYQNMAVKQCQDKTRYLQKRQVENTARTARGNKSLTNNKFC